LTYRELDEVSNRFGSPLGQPRRWTGTGLVALMLPRSAEARRGDPGDAQGGARPTCRSTRRCRRRGSSFMLADTAPVAAVTTSDLADRFHGFDGFVVDDLDLDDSANDTQPTTAPPGPASRRRGPHHLHLRDDRDAQGRRRHPAQRQPSCSRGWRSAFDLGPDLAPQTSVDAVPLVCVRLLGVGRSGVRCCMVGGLVVVPDAVARSAEDFHDLLVRERVHGVDPNPVCGGGVCRRRVWGSAALVIGAEACPPEMVDRWAPGSGDGQRLRPDRDDDVAVQEHPAEAGVRCAADRFADGGGGILRARRMATARATRGGRRNCI